MPTEFPLRLDGLEPIEQMGQADLTKSGSPGRPT